jgi:PIN domain nuclease of toxin-antitoxin system
VRLLLDTHALLWWFSEDPRLSAQARDAVSSAEEVWVSAASVWEIATKRALGKLEAPDDLAAALADSGFRPLPIDVDDALAAGALPRHHDDPFDRMLIAQAQLGGLTIVTRDSRMAPYGVAVLAASA